MLTCYQNFVLAQFRVQRMLDGMQISNEINIDIAKNIMGVNTDPLYYVISPDQPVGWAPPNSFYQKMYQLPHTGSVYNKDKKMV